MLSKRTRVYQTSISMTTAGPASSLASFPVSGNSGNFGNFSSKNQFNLANPSLIPQPVISQAARRRRCDSDVYVKSATDNQVDLATNGFELFDQPAQPKIPPQPRPRPTRLPKMGVTSVTTNRTSTPKSELSSPKSPKYRQMSETAAASPKSPNVRKSQNFDFGNFDNDEPIYCEIATPGKSPKKTINNFSEQKSSNLLRNNYIRQPTVISNSSEIRPKSPNSVRMNYRRQHSNNSESAIIKSPNSVRNGFVRQQISSNNSNSNYIRNIYGKTDDHPQHSSRLSNNFVRNNSEVDSGRLSNNTDQIRASQQQQQQHQTSNFAQRYRVSDSNRLNNNTNSNNNNNGDSETALQHQQQPPSSWSQRYRVADTPVRSVFTESEADPSPIYRVPAPQKMSQSVYGLGRRAHTQLEISKSGWKQSSVEMPSITSQSRCTENPSGLDSGVPVFERHRWERNSINSEATSCSLASYGTQGEEGIVIEARSTLLKGVMWLQREKVFSRWKERFFVLTKDYLQCFKKSTSLITEMGGFVFRVRLCEIDELELIVRRGYLTISLSTPKTGKLLIRKPDGIRRWYQVIQECVTSCKERQEVERERNRFWMRKQLTDSSSMEAWIKSRKQGIDPNYANWTETGSCVSDNATATLLLGATNQLGSRKSLETTDYGFIDGPVRRLLSYQRGTSNRELKSIDERRPSSSTTSPSSALLVRKAISGQKVQPDVTSSICTTFSRDSGIDSMNAANSPGSILSNNSSQVTATSNSVTPTSSVTPNSVTPTRALTESPSDHLASTSFNYCDQFSRKITLV